MLESVLRKLSEKRDLTEKEAKKAFDKIMLGQVSEEEIAKFLIGLKEKGESIHE